MPFLHTVQRDDDQTAVYCSEGCADECKPDCWPAAIVAFFCTYGLAGLMRTAAWLEPRNR